MGEEFHAVIKLITGEEIFALVSVDENDAESNRTICKNKTLVRDPY